MSGWTRRRRPREKETDGCQAPLAPRLGVGHHPKVEGDPSEGEGGVPRMLRAEAEVEYRISGVREMGCYTRLTWRRGFIVVTWSLEERHREGGLARRPSDRASSCLRGAGGRLIQSSGRRAIGGI